MAEAFGVPPRHNRNRRAIRAASGLFIGLSLVLAITGCTDPGVDSNRFIAENVSKINQATEKDLTELLAAAVQQSGSSGAIAGVWTPWAGSWQKAIGNTSFEPDAKPLTDKESVRLTTLTGEITCTIMLRLVDRKQIKLDEPVANHLDNGVGLNGVTMRDLCQHTSGLGDYYQQIGQALLPNPERVWSTAELISNGIADAVPRGSFRFSRSGTLVLANALQSITHKSWQQLAQDEVFNPLGISTISIPDPADVSGRGSWPGYAAAVAADGTPDCAQRIFENRLSSSSGGAAAGAVGKLSDLYKLSTAFATGALLSPKLAEQQWKIVPIGADKPTWQGFGIGGSVYGPMRGLAGEVPGALTAAFTDPSSGLTVVVALNNSASGTDYVRTVAFTLASIASKAPATKKAAAASDKAPGNGNPLVQLPWSLDAEKNSMGQLARCSTPAG